MTNVGVTRHLLGPATVTSIGTLPSEGWQLVHQIATYDMPDTTSGAKYGFVAFATVGAPTNVVYAANSGMELALGYQPIAGGTPTIHHYTGRCRASWDANVYSGWSGSSWMSVTSQAFGFDPSLHVIGIYARIQSPQFVSGSFSVGTATIVAFALDQMNPADYLRSYTFANCLWEQAALAPFKVTSLGTTFAADDEFLFFFNATIEPDSDFISSGLAPKVSASIRGATSGTSYVSVRLGRAATNGVSGRSRFAIGGWAVVTGLVGAVSLHLEGERSAGGFYGKLIQFEVLAIRTSALGSFGYLQDDIVFGSPFATLQSASQSPVNKQTASFSNGFDTDLQVISLVASQNFPPARAPIQIPFAHSITTPDATRTNATSQAPFNPLAILLPEDVGCEYRMAVTNRNAPVSGVIQFWMTSPPPVGAFTPYPPSHYCLAWWDWSVGADGVRDTAPAAPVATFLSIAAESLDVGVLIEIPISPDAAFETSSDLPRNHLESDDLTLRTWPSYMVVRRRFHLTWSALTRAEVETLRAFFVAWTTFKWTRPRDSAAMALTAIDDLQSTNVRGPIMSASINVIELVWTG